MHSIEAPILTARPTGGMTLLTCGRPCRPSARGGVCSGRHRARAVPRLSSGWDTGRVNRALVVDVDGVVAPVGGHTVWGDDVVAGDVFGPVLTSPSLCERLDRLADAPGVACWWLTSWSAQMRAGMTPFPGRAWPTIGEGRGEVPQRPGSARWWKLAALRRWLGSHSEVTSLAWCEDQLSGRDAEVVRRWLALRGVESLLLVPATAVGLTPSHLAMLDAWSVP